MELLELADLLSEIAEKLRQPSPSPIPPPPPPPPPIDGQYPLDFVEAVTAVLLDEGGYGNDPADPGGETNWGIDIRTHPNLDIKNLTRDEAITIYYKDWWQRY